MSARRPDNPSKRREILRAAGRVFRRVGLQRAGMREIAEESGMRAGNLYYYFENKQQLLAFCQEDALDGLLTDAEEIAAEALEPPEHLARLIAAHVARLNEATPGSLAHLEVEALADPWRRSIQERRDRYEAIYRRVIARGIETGLFEPRDPKVAALAILGALNWTVKWYRPGGAYDAALIGREFASLLVRGLLADGAEAPDLGSLGPAHASGGARDASRWSEAPEPSSDSSLHSQLQGAHPTWTNKR